MDALELERRIHQRKLELEGLKAVRRLHAEHLDFTNEVAVSSRMSVSIIERLGACGPMRMADLKIFLCVLYAEYFDTGNLLLADDVLTNMLHKGTIFMQCPGSVVALSPGD